MAVMGLKALRPRSLKGWLEMKRYLHSRVAGFTALLASALTLLAVNAAPALAKGSMIPGTHVSTNPGILYVVAALAALSVVLMGMTVVGSRRRRVPAKVVTLESAGRTQEASAEDRSSRKAA
jgi:hypothetical protein